MSLGLAFWILMLIWFAFGIAEYGWPTAVAPLWAFRGHLAFLFILFLLLGWKTFGAPLHP